MGVKCVLVKAPIKLKNSPINPENPGKPKDAKIAIPDTTVNQGILLARPEKLSIWRLPVRLYNTPTIKNNRDDKIPWDNNWKMAPCQPSGVKDAIPTNTNPMCDTDE